MGIAEPHDYYYAGGERVSIDRDAELVAVDLSRIKDSAQLRELKSVAGRPVAGRIRLVKRQSMPDKVLRSLEKRAAVQPVFRYHDAILVVMPEVRVELAKGQRKKLESLVSAGALRSQIEIDSNGNLVLRPVSGKGTDALALANVLHEKIGPPLAQARFLRVVPSPRVQRSQAVG